MSQHFLLTAAARTLSLKAIFRMSDDEAHDTFTTICFADNGGAAFCPRCQCTTPSEPCVDDPFDARTI